jgi:hypothetical protein
MKKMLILFFLWCSVSAQEGYEVVDEIKGNYKFKSSKSLSFEDWIAKTQELSFTIDDFEEDEYKNIKFTIGKTDNIFRQDNYYIDFFINRKLINRHYITLVLKRQEENAYDILAGKNVFCLNVDDEYLLLYYDYDFSASKFKKIFVFYGK